MKVIATIIRLLILALFLVLMVTGNTFLWLALFGVSLVAAIFFGRVYCGYACPMNTLMIPAEWLSKKLKLQTDKKPKWLKRGVFAWVFLGLTIATMIVTQGILHLKLPILLIWLVVAVIVTLRFKPEVFHNLICPFGTLQRTSGRFAILSKRVNSTSCIGCGLCERACPSGAITVQNEDNKAVISNKLCHQCTNCADVCPEAAITYGKRIIRKTIINVPKEPEAM
jgi:polyferredoxin